MISIRFKCQVVILSCLLLMVLSGFTLAGSKSFQSISQDTGLPSRYIHHIEALDNGYLLFSTNSGARLFDGNNFIPILPADSIPNNPLETSIYVSHEDNQGFIWFGTTSGLFRLDPKTSELRRFAHDANDPSTISNDVVRAIIQDSKGNLWMASVNGLNRFNPETNQFTRVLSEIDDDKNYDSYPISFVVEDLTGKIWFGGNFGFRYFDYHDNKIHRPKLPFSELFTPEGLIAQNGHLWIGSEKEGLFDIDLTDFSYHQYKHENKNGNSMASDSAWNLFEDNLGQIWIGHWDGMSILDQTTGQFENYTFNKDDPNGLPGSSVEDFTVDHSGLIWLATTNGAASFDSSALVMQRLFHIESEDNSLRHDDVWCFSETTDGKVWVGTSLGLELWDPANSKVIHYPNDPDNPKSITKGGIWDIELVDANTLILASDIGVDIFDIPSATVKHLVGLPDKETGIAAQPYYQVHKINANQFIVGGSTGNIHVIDTSTNQVNMLIARTKHIEMNSIEYITLLKSDSNGDIWIGTTTGLLKYNPKTQTMTEFNTDSQRFPLHANTINAMYIDNNDIVWVGTAGGGIHAIQTTQNASDPYNIRYVTTEDGLPENIINGLAGGENQTLWFSTSRHIGQIDTQTLNIKELSVTPKEEHQFLEGTGFAGQSGHIYFGGNGVYRFDPTSIHQTDFIPEVKITSVSSMHQAMPGFTPLALHPSIEFNPEDTLITIGFAALDYGYPEHNQYRYKLEGVDKEWLQPNSEYHAIYTHLPYGQYRFQVQGSNRDGKWSDKEALLLITVNPPIWRTKIAYSLYILLIVLSGVLIWKSRSRERAKELHHLQAIQRSESRLKNALWGSGDELWQWDLTTGSVSRTNPIHDLDFNTQNSQLNQMQLIDVIHDDDKQTFFNEVEKHLKGHTDFYEFQCRVRDKTQQWHWILSRGRIIEKSDDGKPKIMAGTVRDIEDIKKKEQQLTAIANYDQLTGLPNRFLFGEQLSHAILQAKRFKESIALLFLDLDGFKLINDTHGHSVGDELLKNVAKRLQVSARTSDNVARLGGDEFTIILERAKSANTIVPVLDRLIGDLTRPFKLGKHMINTATSIGIAFYPDDGEDVDTLLKNADIAMYEAKKNGKGIYRFFTEEMNSQIRARLTLEQELRDALLNEEFEVHYQPKVGVSSGIILGVEALVRWIHPKKGPIPPDVFIPIAEETGLIFGIGQWVLKSACQQAALWRQQGWQGVVSVNLSAQEIQQEDLAKHVQAVLAESQLPAHALELEVTEGVFITNLKQAGNVSDTIRSLGVRIALDDFGTGFSSLAYLKNLPIDTLKIDRSFVSEIEQDKRTFHLVEAIVRMAQCLNLEVVAEGVETHEQLSILSKFGCHEYQGYYFSKPLPAKDCEGLLFNKLN